MKLVTLLCSYLTTCNLVHAEEKASDYDYNDTEPDYFYSDYDSEDYDQWTNEDGPGSDEDHPLAFGPAGRSLGIGTLDFDSLGNLGFPGFNPHLRKLKQTWKILAHIAPGIQSSTPKRQKRQNQHKYFLKNYGCYCFVTRDGSKIVAPRNGYNGPPKDELDALCMTLFKAQKCLSAEQTENEQGDQCRIDRNYAFTLRDQEFDTDGNPLLSDEEMISCLPKKLKPHQIKKWSKRPKNICKKTICEVEKEFAIRVKNLWESGFRQTNPDIIGMNDREYVNQCVNIEKRSLNEDSADCCGKGMDRRSYNPVNKMCCADESLAPVGSC